MKVLGGSASLVGSCLLLVLVATTSGVSNAFVPLSTTRSVRPSSSFLLDTNSVQDPPETTTTNSEPTTASTTTADVLVSSDDDETPSFFDKLVDGVKFRYGLFQNARGEGYDLKLSMACALAGEYDSKAVRDEVQEIIQSHPCVMFTWAASPSCKNAINAFDKIGNVDVKIVRLDDPWEKGNPMRAEIGKMVGKSSVPMIFIDGTYVGGYDSGVSDDAPGILDLAFQGTLRPKLEAAGALPAP
eukprot:scaffold7294_cov93-Cylindrotheca_fusiformis.AAC.6